MGVPSGGGSNLGAAQGRITIDISQLQAAQVAVQAASQQINAALSQISPNAQRAQLSLNQLSGALRQVGAVFGVTFGAAGIAQLARFVVEVDAIATAYRRQNIAAVSLAGSQEHLNELMVVYQQATGGAIDTATALSDVTRLMAVGFADSTEEIDQFARAIRGISVASGRTQEFVTNNLILELFSQRGQRLDQIVLDYQLVRQATAQLQAADASLTKEMAYQQAVLDQAIERYGALASSAEAAATGLELLGRISKEARREIGQALAPATDFLGNFAATALLVEIAKLRTFQTAIENVTEAWMDMLRALGLAPAAAATPAVPKTPDIAAPAFDPDQLAAIEEWSRNVAEIERQAARDRTEATRQYESQRTEIIRQYEQTIAREAQDFALQRQRSEQDYAISLQRIHRDIANREAQQAEELERTLADARADAQERTADRLVDVEERIADARATSRERIAELEEDFNRKRERAQRDHSERILDAAGRLDAKAIADAQRQFANRQRDEKEDFEDRLDDARKSEEKRIADLKKAHDKQTEDEKEQLEERIKQALDAHQRQLEDAREADEQRLADMSADMVLRRAREDEDRVIRLQRMREDFEAQLAELASQHLDNIVRINREEAEELAARNTAFDAQMADLGIYHAGVEEAQKAHQTRSLLRYQQYLDALEAQLTSRFAAQGPQPQNSLITPGQFPSINPGGIGSLPSGYTPPPPPNTGTPSISSSVSLGNVSVTVIGGSSSSGSDIAQAVRSELVRLLEEVAS